MSVLRLGWVRAVVVLGLVVAAGCGMRVVGQVAGGAPLPGAAGTDPMGRKGLGLKTPENSKLPTLWLVGDSTVRNGHADGAGGQWGWGEPLVDFFDTTKINVVNRALGGRSSRSYIAEGQWAETLAMVKPGDVILFQWGHNDDGPLDDPARARGTIKGIGDETKDVHNPVLKIDETVHSYGWYLRKYVVETIAKGATPVICSPIPRKTWRDGKVVRNAESYGGWARAIAVQQHVAFVDLNEIIGRKYDALGEAAVEPLFADPHTHTSRAGAELNAEAVVAGLKGLPKDPVAAFYSAKGKAVAPYSADVVSAVSSPPAPQDKAEAVLETDLAEMERCHLTLDSLRRYYAAAAELSALARTDARLAGKLSAEPGSLDANTRMYQSEPAFVAILARQGFTPRQYSVVGFTTVQTIFASMAKQEGASAAVLAGVHVAPGNIELFEQHGREIQAFQKAGAANRP